ncbi:CoA-binding protein [Sphingomonas panni]
MRTSDARSFPPAHPRSVVIVGASPTPGALGNSVLRNLERHGYAGTIHLINPKRDTIDGRPCLKSIDDLPMGVDAAVLAIPGPAVLGAVRALAARGVGAAIIFSAGFAEGARRGWPHRRRSRASPPSMTWWSRDRIASASSTMPPGCR